MALPFPEHQSGYTEVHWSSNAKANGAQRPKDQRPTPLRSNGGWMDRSLYLIYAPASSYTISSPHRRTRGAQRARRGARAFGGMVRSALARTAHRLKRRALQVVHQLAAIEVRAPNLCLANEYGGLLSQKSSAHTNTQTHIWPKCSSKFCV